MTKEQKFKALENRMAKLKEERKSLVADYKANPNDIFTKKFIEWKDEEIEEVQQLLTHTIL